MKRNPRKVKWTKAYRKLAGKELAEDSTFEMERRRNRPEKYNRELIAKTLTAIKKVDKIRARRQERFTEARKAKVKAPLRAAARKELEKQIHLVRAPESLLKDAEKVKGEKIKVMANEVEHAMDQGMDMSD